MGGSAGKNLLLEADGNSSGLSVCPLRTSEMAAGASQRWQVRESRLAAALRQGPFLGRYLGKNNHDMLRHQRPNHNMTVILSSPC